MSFLPKDVYVRGIVNKYTTNQRLKNVNRDGAIQTMARIIRLWAGRQLNDIWISGSYAKQTAINGATDVDLFISLHSNTRESLRQVYYKLNNRLSILRYQTRLQNVSIGLNCNGFKFDLVPGIRHYNYQYVHSLYKRKQDTWTQTNIVSHINLVSNSNRVEEICATKIWAIEHGIDFPSFYLELSVIKALSGFGFNKPGQNFVQVLNYLANNFYRTRIVDPSNTANIVSEELSLREKLFIAGKAKECLNKEWRQVLW